MRTYRDTVFVLKSLDYSETDKILTVFGLEGGKFSLIAKGIRKISSKNRGNMQTLSLSAISYYKGQGMPVLMETQNIAYIDFLNEDMEDLQRVLLVLNKLLAEGEPNEKIFKALESIVRKGIDTENVNKFRVLFLNQEGFLATGNECSLCGREEDLNYIDSTTFELICESCYSKKDIKPQVVLPINESLYQSKKLTAALDLYITNLLAQA